MKQELIDRALVAERNSRDQAALDEDYGAFARRLERGGIDLAPVRAKLAAFGVALPSWGTGRGGTRFAKFTLPGEPVTLAEKLADCAVVHQLSRAAPRVSLHFPWDKADDYPALRQQANALGLGFDAVNSNTFQDQPAQPHSYAHGSLAAQDAGARAQAIAHNLECIEIGRQLGAAAITVWVGDGTNFPGQQDLARSFDRYLAAAAEVYAALPADWRMFLEHKLYEPAFYATVISDWGSSLLAAQTLGPQAQCLVDLGHHAPNVNIEQIVARLHYAGKLGGFHFNDSKYGDDDLDSGSINPHQLFLVFNELVEAELNPRHGFAPAYTLDQSHNVTDPIESLIVSAEAVQAAYAKALLVDRELLAAAQEQNDAMRAFRTLRAAYDTDVRPLIASVRAEAGGAIDPVGAYRASGWRAAAAKARRPAGTAAGIV